MPQPQLRVNWTVEVNEPKPIDVASSLEPKKDVLTVKKNCKSLN
jgi:hypothetical protein